MKLHYLGKKERKNSILVLIIILLSVVLYLGNMFTFNTSDLVSIICIITFPLVDISVVLAIIAFLIPLNSGITILYIYGYAIVILLFKKRSVNLRVLIPVLVIILWEILMSLFAPSVNFTYLVIYACTFFLLLYLIHTDDADYKVCCYAYIAGTMVLLLAIMTTAIQNASWEAVMSGKIRIGAYEGKEALGGSVALLSENANSLAYYALVAIVLAFSLIKTENLTGRILLIAAVVFGTVVGLFTVSRTFLIVLLLGIFFVFTSRYNTKQRIILAIVIGGILWVGIPYLMEHTSIFDAFSDRFSDDTVQGAGGRTEIMLKYFEFLWNNPARLLFGTGAINYIGVCKIQHSTHNGLQQILVCYGLIGFFPIIYVLLKPVLVFFRRNKFTFEKIVPLLCVIIFTQTIQFLNPFNLMLPYAIAIMYMKIPEKVADL